jgi:hypothetical protein
MRPPDAAGIGALTGRSCSRPTSSLPSCGCRPGEARSRR